MLRSKLRIARAGMYRMVAMLGLLLAMLPMPAAAQTAYVLGPNDLITVVVYGQSEFNVATRVKSDGSIVMPLIGRVEAAGKTNISLAEEITRRLESGNYLKSPIVNVEVTEFNSRYVRLAGKVGAPALVPLDRSDRLLDILLRSGWVRDDGSPYVMIRRAADGKEVRVNVQDLARGATDDVRLQPGDTIYVADAELVYLTGAVARPGAFPLKPGMTVQDLIARAGGVGPSGNSNKVGLKRGNEKERDVDTSTVLKEGDVINVKERLF